MSARTCFAVPVMLVLVLAIPSSVLAQSHSDGFEAPTLDPWWHVWPPDDGYYSFVTAPDPVFAGAQSLRVDSRLPAPSGIMLGHVFQTPIYGRVSVWVYDTGAVLRWGQRGSLGLRCWGDSAEEGYLSLGADDWQNTYYLTCNYNSGGALELNTSRPRTQAWHKWEIEWLPDSVTFRLDETVVYSVAQGMKVTNIGLNINSSQVVYTEFHAYWDDFEFEQYVPPPVNPFTISDFQDPMGAKKKLGSTLPVKFQLFDGDVEMQTPEQIGQALGLETPVSPRILVYDATDLANALGIDLPDDGNVGEGGDLGDCFRYSDGNWIFNLRLNAPIYAPGSFVVKVKIGDLILEPGNDMFQTK